MKVDLVYLLAIYLLGYFQSEYTSYVVNTLLGKIIVLIIIINVAIQKPYLGVLLIILYVLLSKSPPPRYHEFMTGMDVNNFRNKYCKNNNLMKDGNIISEEQIATIFPNISFEKDKCNPCDSSCKFNITTSSERLTTEYNIRPTPSKEYKVCKTTDPEDDLPEPKPNSYTQLYNNI